MPLPAQARRALPSILTTARAGGPDGSLHHVLRRDSRTTPLVAPHTLTCSPACARERDLRERDLWRKRQALRAEAREATG